MHCAPRHTAHATFQTQCLLADTHIILSLLIFFDTRPPTTAESAADTGSQPPRLPFRVIARRRYSSRRIAQAISQLETLKAFIQPCTTRDAKHARRR